MRIPGIDPLFHDPAAARAVTAAGWRDRVPAAVHVDGTARLPTVEERREPLVARVLRAPGAGTGRPVVVDTSLHTAARPPAGDPRDAPECCGSAPVDLPASGPYAVPRGRAYA